MRGSTATRLVGAACAVGLLTGCGSTLSRSATEQLLTSDAVDQTVASMDFSDLAGSTVFFETEYVKNVKGVGFVNSEYIISSLRQQMVAARCLLRDKKDEAEFVVEARVGALGTDAHELTYGMPANNVLNSAASIVPGAPALPSLPELSVAKRNDQLGAAKIGVFAYHRQTGEPVWQSGVRQSRSTAKDFWIFGAGPFQNGTIHRGNTRFAGERLKWLPGSKPVSAQNTNPLTVDYTKEARFPIAPPFVVEADDGVPEPLDATSELFSNPQSDRPADIDSAIDRHLRLGWKTEAKPAEAVEAASDAPPATPESAESP